MLNVQCQCNMCNVPMSVQFHTTILLILEESLTDCTMKTAYPVLTSVRFMYKIIKLHYHYSTYYLKAITSLKGQ